MKKTIYILITLCVLSCKKAPIDGCLDKKATNYNSKSDVNCCCIYNPMVTIYTDSNTLERLRIHSFDTIIYAIKDGIRYPKRNIKDLLNKNNFRFTSIVDKNNNGKMELEIYTSIGQLLYARKFESMNAYDNIMQKITY